MLKKAGKLSRQEALLNYCNTPAQGHSLSPTQRSMGRCTRGLLPISRHLLVPNQRDSASTQVSIAKKKAAAKQQYDKHKGDELPPIKVGDFVYVKPPPHRKAGPWPYGVVTETQSPRSYTVNTPTGISRRNRVHVRPAAPPPQGALIPRSWGKYTPASPVVSSAPPIVSVPETENTITAENKPVHVPQTPKKVQPSNIQKVNSPAPVAGTKHHAGQSAKTVMDRKAKEQTSPVITKYGRVSKPVKRLDL